MWKRIVQELTTEQLNWPRLVVKDPGDHIKSEAVNPQRIRNFNTGAFLPMNSQSAENGKLVEAAGSPERTPRQRDPFRTNFSHPLHLFKSQTKKNWAAEKPWLGP